MAALILVSGCSSINITSTWKAPAVVLNNYHKIMVLGIIREADRSLREQMENHLTGDLRSLGYNVFSAYHEYGPKAFEGMSEAEASETLEEDGVDAVITVVLLDKQREKYYAPGRIVYSPYMIYHDRIWGYYHSIYNRVVMPGYYLEATKYFWESNFYDLTVDKLIYSVQTQSFDPVSTEALAHEYGQKIVQNMVQNRVLQTQGNGLKAM